MRPRLLFLCAFALAASALVACSNVSSDKIDASTPAELPHASPTSGTPCGGMIAGSGQTCAGENEYCHYAIKDMCGAADAPGTCKVKPEMCTMDYAPVCGCDGQTYPNECAANSRGISAASQGECK